MRYSFTLVLAAVIGITASVAGVTLNFAIATARLPDRLDGERRLFLVTDVSLAAPERLLDRPGVESATFLEIGTASLTVAGEGRRVRVLEASEDLLHTIPRVRIIAGRTSVPPGRNSMLILWSERFWKDQLAPAPGAAILINSAPATLAGVLGGAVQALGDPDVIVLKARGFKGRIGTPVSTAGSVLQGLLVRMRAGVGGRELEAALPDSLGRSAKAVSVHEWYATQTRRFTAALNIGVFGVAGLGAVSLLLLTLAAIERSRGDYLTRVALGARPIQLMGPAFRPVGLAAFLGAFVAVALSSSLGGLALTVAPALALTIGPGAVNPINPLLIVAGLVTITAVGLIAGLTSIYIDARRVLGGNIVAGVRNRRLVDLLLALQLAVSIIACTLLWQATGEFRNWLRTPIGVDTSGSFSFRISRMPRPAVLADYYRVHVEAVEAIETVTGVTAGAATTRLPLTDAGSGLQWAEGVLGRGGMVQVTHAIGSYSRALGMQIDQGNHAPLGPGTSSAHVAYVSQAAANMLWPGAQPVGQSLRLGDQTVEVIGVVQPVRGAGEFGTIEEQIYVPATPENAPAEMLYVARCTVAVSCLPAVVDAVRKLFPDGTVYDVVTAEDLRGRWMAVPRAQAQVLVIGASGTGALVVLGMAAIATIWLERRRHELAVRAALGASSWSVSRALARRFAAAFIGGAVLGTLGSAVAIWQFSVVSPSLGGRPLWHVAPGIASAFVVAALMVVAMGVRAWKTLPLAACLRGS